MTAARQPLELDLEIDRRGFLVPLKPSESRRSVDSGAPIDGMCCGHSAPKVAASERTRLQVIEAALSSPSRLHPSQHTTYFVK